MPPHCVVLTRLRVTFRFCLGRPLHDHLNTNMYVMFVPDEKRECFCSLRKGQTLASFCPGFTTGKAKAKTRIDGHSNKVSDDVLK